MPEPTVSAGIVSGFVRYAGDRGVPVRTLADTVAIHLEQLDDPDGRVPFPVFQTLVRMAQQSIGDPALLLRYSDAVDMSEDSILGLIMNASAKMGEAFAQMQRFGRLALDDPEFGPGPRFALEQRDEKLFMVHRHSVPADFPEWIESAFARLVSGPRRFLDRPHVQMVHFAHAASSIGSDYEEIFQCPVRFDQKRNEMELHPDIASWPVAQAPRYVLGVLTDRANALIEKMDTRHTMQGRLEELLLPRLHTGNYSSTAAAAALGLSRQTLFRRLKKEGTDYSTVLENLRCRMAGKYLASETISINEVAYLLGFSDPSAFSRAFKRWTGMSPRRYRQEQDRTSSHFSGGSAQAMT